VTAALIEARDLVKTYTSRKGPFGKAVAVRAVDRLSISVAPATTLGIVGESGSGKSTTGRLLLGLEDPSEGEVTFEGSALPRQETASWRALRARMQLVYQDPLAALDRRLPIGRQIAEPLEIHGIGTPDEQKARVAELMQASGFVPTRLHATRTSFRAGSASASSSRVPSRPNRASSCVMSPCRRWTFPFRRRS
jgi:peptide/nickel transport system ATP-binding protein